jgi:hypothetical protein
MLSKPLTEEQFKKKYQIVMDKTGKPMTLYSQQSVLVQVFRNLLNDVEYAVKTMMFRNNKEFEQKKQEVELNKLVADNDSFVQMFDYVYD